MHFRLTADPAETSRDAYWIYYTCSNCGATAKEAISSAPPVEASLSLEEDEMRDGCNEYLPIYTYVTHDYIYASGKLLRETITTTVDGEVTETTILNFFYDQSGRPYSFTCNGTEYYYILNLQGDVVRIYDVNGTQAASYTYNAWGEIITQFGTMADVNPIRYRGYYYDAELEMYYLQSRYYDPAVCKFINRDAYASTGQEFIGYNMFAYCLNNPINYSDSKGNAAKRSHLAYDRDRDLNSQLIEDSFDTTMSMGVSGSISLGIWEFGGQIFITSGTDGKSALQYSFSGGATSSGSFGGSLAGFITVTDAGGYEDLEGFGCNIGTGLIPIEYNMLIDEETGELVHQGLTYSLGLSTPGVHVLWGETQTICEVDFDLFEYFEQVYYQAFWRE